MIGHHEVPIYIDIDTNIPPLQLSAIIIISNGMRVQRGGMKFPADFIFTGGRPFHPLLLLLHSVSHRAR